MGFLPQSELERCGFRYLGNNVLLSDKASIYDSDQIEIGENSRIDDFCVVSGRVSIGRNVHIAVFCNVAGGTEGIRLDDFSGLAYGCQLFAQSDDYSGATMTNPTVPAAYKNETRRRIHVGRHCILGTQSLVFPGVSIGEGTSVGAQSVVTRSTEEWSIYLGNPAKKLKDRKRDLLLLEAKYLASEYPASQSAR